MLGMDDAIYMLTAAAPTPPALIHWYEQFGLTLMEGFGQTEAMGLIANTLEDRKIGSIGRPVGEVEVRLSEEDELQVRAEGCSVGYYNMPEKTAETFVDGWIRTGDLARLDEEGFCYICDRAKDMVIRGGENIYSSEVENVLYDHPAVTDAALIGLPHKQLGEEPAAVVHCSPGHDVSEAELQAWVGDRLAKFKIPVKIVFVEQTLPRNANGKILKKDLPKLYFGVGEEEGAAA